MRPLGIPTMTDRAMQALYLLGLDPIEETLADRSSYGFRLDRRCADALERCRKVLLGRHGARVVLEGDIKSCYDRISHDWVLDNVPMDKAILKKWLKAGFLEKGVFFATTEGTPQGGIIAPQTILQTAPFGALNKRVGRHLVDDTHLARIDLDPLDQGADDLPLSLPVGLFQFFSDLLRELLHLAENRLHLLFLVGNGKRLRRFRLEILQALLGAADSRLELATFQQPVLVGVDQPRHATLCLGDLRLELFHWSTFAVRTAQTPLILLLEPARVG
jgi:hypothetical protein